MLHGLKVRHFYHLDSVVHAQYTVAYCAVIDFNYLLQSVHWMLKVVCLTVRHFFNLDSVVHAHNTDCTVDDFNYWLKICIACCSLSV